MAAVRTSKPHCSSRVFYPLPSSHHLLFLLKPGTQRGLYSSSHQSADQANGCSPVHTLKWCAITRSPPEHFHMGSLTHSKALLGSFPSSWKQVCQMGRESLHAPPWFIDTYGWPDQGAGPRTVQAGVYVSSRKFVFNGNCGCTSLTVQLTTGKGGWLSRRRLSWNEWAGDVATSAFSLRETPLLQIRRAELLSENVTYWVALLCLGHRTRRPVCTSSPRSVSICLQCLCLLWPEAVIWVLCYVI